MTKSIHRPDTRLPGKAYVLTEAEKAAQLRISTSWLQKDRVSESPQVDFARYGRTIRYAAN